MSDKNLLYSEVYRLLNKVTPLQTDCGFLCDKACCKGIEADLGMYLFPGEEERHFSSDFLTIAQLDLNGNHVLLAKCTGECEREKRPLACRIFPLTPYITLKGLLTIKMDPRANLLCPLARSLQRSELNPVFVKNVRKSFQLLLKDSEIENFIANHSRLYDDMESYFG